MTTVARPDGPFRDRFGDLRTGTGDISANRPRKAPRIRWIQDRRPHAAATLPGRARNRKYVRNRLAGHERPRESTLIVAH